MGLQNCNFRTNRHGDCPDRKNAESFATQLLLCLGALAMPPSSNAEAAVMCSPRKVLLEIRSELAAPRPRRDFDRRLASAQRERRPRSTAKEKRTWPRRKPHKPPDPPLLLPIDDHLKPKFEQHLKAA